MIAALYVDPRGPYPKMPGVECWTGPPESDARCYMGPHPVVAHPPCGNYSKINYLRGYDDSDCAIRAVEQVRAYGGVLEHPAHKLWGVELDNVAQRLPLPGNSDEIGGYTIAVNQCDWGHVCRKPTWLYLVGVPTSLLQFPRRREPTHWASGGRTKSSRTGSDVPHGIKVASGGQRNRTPDAFAEMLVGFARAAGKSSRFGRLGYSPVRVFRFAAQEEQK